MSPPSFRRDPTRSSCLHQVGLFTKFFWRFAFPFLGWSAGKTVFTQLLGPWDWEGLTIPAMLAGRTQGKNLLLPPRKRLCGLIIL